MACSNIGTVTLAALVIGCEYAAPSVSTIAAAVANTGAPAEGLVALVGVLEDRRVFFLLRSWLVGAGVNGRVVVARYFVGLVKAE